MTAWLTSHPNLFGLILSLLGGAGVVWIVCRPEWDKDD